MGTTKGGAKMTGFYCFSEWVQGVFKINYVVKYYFENGKEIYYTTEIDKHQKKTFCDRMWSKKFLDQLVEV